eukprot:m.67783 g.67783  ORF g.67783 m.67783 type:complete len:1010 (+) comp8468_c0_seq2:201-3230(+)
MDHADGTNGSGAGGSVSDNQERRSRSTSRERQHSESVTYPPTTNPHAPAGIIATRTDVDNPHLESLVGRIVGRYFAGYGNFLGMVKRKVPTRPVVEVEYEDGDGEELYLDQLLDALMPLGTLPNVGEKDPAATKYGYVWPPPTTSTRLLVSRPRQRKPSVHALNMQRLAEQQQQMALDAIRLKAERARQREEERAKRKAAAAAMDAEKQRQKEEEAKEEAKKKLAEEKLKKRREKNAKRARERRALLKKAKESTATPAGTATTDATPSPLSSTPPPSNNVPSGPSADTVSPLSPAEEKLKRQRAIKAEKERQRRARIKREKMAQAAAVDVNTVDSASDVSMTPSSTLTGGGRRTTSSSGKRKRQDSTPCAVPTETQQLDASASDMTPTSLLKRQSKRPNKKSTGGREWTKCDACGRKHWSDTTCTAESDDDHTGSDDGMDTSGDRSGRSSLSRPARSLSNDKRWTGNTTATLLMALKAEVSSDGSHAAAAVAGPLLSSQGPTNAPYSATAAYSHNPLNLLMDAAALTTPHLVPSTAVRAPPLSSAVGHSTPRGTPTAPTVAIHRPLSDRARGGGSRAAGRNVVRHNQPAPTAPAARAASTVSTLPPTAAAAAHPSSSTTNGAGSALPRHPDVTHAYQIIKSKMDITSGGDGYGMTGNCTQASMARLFDALQTTCELGPDSWFMDLGHGMGRPPIHAALLDPPVAGAVGTEFNPELYKQSMLALRECTQSVKGLEESSRVFFMDANIKDFMSLNPFTHVFSFQIGMPADVVDCIFDLLSTSASVKYAILFPHRTVTTKRLNQLGDIVYSQSMAMPGGRSYEVNVVRVRHSVVDDLGNQASTNAAPVTPTVDNGHVKDCSATAEGHADATPTTNLIDPAVTNALEVMRDKRLYNKYLEQLGAVAILESEQNFIMSSRGQRRQATNTKFLEQSPCLPDINYGFIRRVAVMLGVSPTGTKVQILSNIQQYVPVTFGLSMLAIGDNYTDASVQRVVDKLLAVPPSRRQPEAVHM